MKRIEALYGKDNDFSRYHTIFAFDFIGTHAATYRDCAGHGDGELPRMPNPNSSTQEEVRSWKYNLAQKPPRSPPRNPRSSDILGMKPSSHNPVEEINQIRRGDDMSSST